MFQTLYCVATAQAMVCNDTRQIELKAEFRIAFSSVTKGWFGQPFGIQTFPFWHFAWQQRRKTKTFNQTNTT